MFNKIKQHLLPSGILILISFLVHHVWFSNLSPITYGDWMVDLPEKIKENFSWPSIWFSDSNLGGLNFGISFWPFLFFSGALTKLNIDINLIERLVFLWPIALLIPISMYLLSYYILRSKTAAFISAIVFEFNTYIIILKGGHLTLLMAITLAPFFLLCFMKTLNEKKILYVIINVFLGFIISFYEFRIFYLICWLVFFYTIYYLVIIEKIKKIRQIIKIIFLSGIPIILIFLLNAYFLLGIYGSKSLESNSIFDRSLFGTWYIKLTKVMTIFHFGWNGGKMIPWKIEPMQWWFFLVPILAFLGSVVGKKNKLIPFFTFIGLLGIFLTKLNTPPFPDIYQWLFDHVPGFNAFRESGKFFLYVAISYAVLIGAFISWLWQQAKDRKKIVIAFFLTVLAALLFLWNAKPLITGEFGTLFVQRKIPNDYLIVKDFLSKQKEYFRTLWIPQTSRWSYRINSMPTLSDQVVNLNNWLSFETKDNHIYTKQFANQLYDIASIKYFFIPLEDKANDDNFFEYISMIKRSGIINQINRLNYLKRINIGTKEIVVYENKNYRPHVYLTSSMETVYKNIPYIKTSFKYISPTQYKINLKNTNKPVFINFSESYHPLWRIRVGEFNWFKVLTEKSYFISDKSHFKNDAQLNSFSIDPVSICKSYECKKNTEGTYDIDLTLYFSPQSYVYLGLIIGGITLLGCLSYLAWSWIRGKILS